MSADSFYNQVEKNIKGRKKLYYFKGFVTCVGKSKIAIGMNFFDFFDFENNLMVTGTWGEVFRVHPLIIKILLKKTANAINIIFASLTKILLDNF